VECALSAPCLMFLRADRQYVDAGKTGAMLGSVGRVASRPQRKNGASSMPAICSRWLAEFVFFRIE